MMSDIAMHLIVTSPLAALLILGIAATLGRIRKVERKVARIEGKIDILMQR